MMSCFSGGGQPSESDGETTQEGGRVRPSKGIQKSKKSRTKREWKRKKYYRKCKTVRNDLPKCIVIPFLEMYGEKLNPTPSRTVRSSLYKLIDGYPCNGESDLYIRTKYYVMSYNIETKNADWVYEILNKEILKDINCKNNISFGDNEFEDRDYAQGHLAAAANHRWCQEAYHDTHLISK